MIRLVSWNMAHQDYWGHLTELDLDVALLQEVPTPRQDCALEVASGSRHAMTDGGLGEAGEAHGRGQALRTALG